MVCSLIEYTSGMGLSTLHTSPLPPQTTFSADRERLEKHRDALLTRLQREYVSVAEGRFVEYGIYKYEEEGAFCEVSVGASLVTIKPARPKSMDTEREVGGVRGLIVGFSSASRRRLMRMIARTERDNRPIFATLTYPDVFDTDKDKWKRDIDVFGKRFARQFPGGAFVWRVEFKHRKTGVFRDYTAPHWHLLIWGVDMVSWREFADNAWYEVVGSGDERHRRAGVSSERIKSWRGTLRYVSKYVSKVDEHEEDLLWLGRVWGVVSRKNMPFGVRVIVPLSDDDARVAIRLVRKMLSMDRKTLVWGITFIFDVEQWLDYLEYLYSKG